MAKELLSEQGLRHRYKQDVTIDLPPPEHGFYVRWAEWKRIKRALERTPEQNQIWLKVAIALFGLCMPTLLSALTLIPHTTGLPDWVPTVWWCIGVAEGVGTILCAIFHRRTKSARAQHIKNILSEMEQLEPVSTDGKGNRECIH